MNCLATEPPEKDEAYVYLPTGIWGLDHMLFFGSEKKKGLPNKSFIMLEGSVDVEEYLFTIVKNVANYRLRLDGEELKVPIIIATSEEPRETLPNLIKTKARWSDFDLKKYNNVKIKDFFLRFQNPENVEGDIREILRNLREKEDITKNGGLIVLYSISKFSVRWSDHELLELTTRLTNVAVTRSCTFVGVVNPYMHSKQLLAKISRCADFIIKLVTITEDRMYEKALIGETITLPIETDRIARAYPYTIDPNAEIIFYRQIPEEYTMKPTSTLPSSDTGKTRVFVNIPPIDLDSKATTRVGIPTLYTYALEYSYSYVELYPLLFRMIDGLISSGMNVILIYTEDSPDTFLYKLETDTTKKKYKEFLDHIKNGRITFIDCSRSKGTAIIKECGEEPLIRIKDIHNIPELLYHLKLLTEPESGSEISKVKIVNGKPYGPAIIFATFSGLVSIIGFERAYKMLTQFLVRYIWVTEEESGAVVWLLVNPGSMTTTDWSRLESNIDGEIKVMEREIRGNRINYLLVNRLPERTDFITSWIPYIVTEKYPPGTYFILPQYFGKILVRRDKK